MKYDLADTNILYDGDIMAKHNKSKLVGQIENLLPEIERLKDLRSSKEMVNSCVIVSC